ncbi:MAG: hypothetical protein U0S12_02030 [Fimbriimonadales bacterium]
MTAAALCIFAAVSMLQSSPIDREIETALGVAGLSSQTARFDPAWLNFYGQGEFQTPLFQAVMAEPWKLPFVAEVSRRELGTLVGTPSETLNAAARWVGFNTRRSLLGDPAKAWLEQTTSPGALDRLLADWQSKGMIKGKLPSTEKVPAAVRQAAAIVLIASEQALEFRKLAFAGIGNLDAAYALFAKGVDDTPLVFDKSLKVMRGTDLKYLGAGGYDVLLASQTAASLLSAVAPSTAYDVQIETTYGLIRLTGGSPTTHANVPTLLAIDTGGNDIYLGAPCNASTANFLSVVIDSEGLDTYLSDAQISNTTIAKFPGRKDGTSKPGPAGALFGYAVLIDLQGDDVYRTHRPGLGSGRFGIAALLDKAGNDTYDGYADSEGFAQFGAGILEDVAGKDRYEGFSQVQGMGAVQGLGLLIDRAGDDTYVSNDTTIDFPSPQSAEHNVSMSQGAGNGRRADYLDGHSLAGGVGLLYDMGGKDTYTCGVFGQGVGYWMGVGMLWDDSGVDLYSGQWYVQGAAAHFAVGYLDEGEGNDRYNAPMNMAQGAGHDFSFGLLVDRAGDDTYRAPNLSLGAGNANGIGGLLELGGNDTYESLGVTLGKAAEAPKQSLRSRLICFGLFMDLGGNDKYPAAATWASNGAQGANWTDRGPTPAESQVGAFWDR